MNLIAQFDRSAFEPETNEPVELELPLKLPKGFQAIQFPEVNHRQISFDKTVVYPLPEKLRQSVEKCLRDSIDAESLDFEKELTKHAREHRCAAFRWKSPLVYPMLIDYLPPLTVDLMQQAGSTKMTEKSTNLANRNLGFFARYSKAYCGWLVSQSEYWKDVDLLLETGVMQDGTSICAIPPVSVPKDMRVEADSDTAASIVVIHEFYAKWRLKNLATMDWPIILQPLLTPTTPYTSNSPRGTINPVYPDIFPIDGDGILSNILNDASQSNDAPHLSSWRTVISRDSRLKKRVDSFARRFEFQHYWRVLNERYPNELAKSVNALDSCFAEYFDVSADTIRSDRRALHCAINRPLSMC